MAEKSIVDELGNTMLPTKGEKHVIDKGLVHYYMHMTNGKCVE
jgi:hypothetical protein